MSHKEQIQTVSNQRSKEMQKQRRSNQETIVQQLKQGTGSTPRNTTLFGKPADGEDGKLLS